MAALASAIKGNKSLAILELGCEPGPKVLLCHWCSLLHLNQGQGLNSPPCAVPVTIPLERKE
jgi:hypothetical protein